MIVRLQVAARVHVQVCRVNVYDCVNGICLRMCGLCVWHAECVNRSYKLCRAECVNRFTNNVNNKRKPYHLEEGQLTYVSVLQQRRSENPFLNLPIPMYCRMQQPLLREPCLPQSLILSGYV